MELLAASEELDPLELLAAFELLDELPEDEVELPARAEELAACRTFLARR